MQSHNQRIASRLAEADLIASFLGTFLGPHAFAIMGLCNIDETRANRGEMGYLATGTLNRLAA